MKEEHRPKSELLKDLKTLRKRNKSLEAAEFKRKQSELKNHTSDEIYRLLFEHSRDAILLTSPDGRILAANPAACEMFGRSVEEICNFGKDGLVDQGDPNIPIFIEERSRTGRATGIIYHLKKDGTRFPTEVSSSLFETAEGQRTSMIIRDMTQHMQTEDALRTSETRYQSLFQNMLNGIAYCKMLFEQGRPQDFIYLDVNTAFENLTGLRNVVGKKVSEVIPGLRTSDPDLFERYARVATTGKPEVFETYVESLKMWFSISAYSPKKDYFIAVFEVITERKRSEEKITEQARLLEVALDTIIVRDMNDRLVFWNKAAEKLYGWTFEEAQLLKVFQLINEQDRKIYEQAMKEFLQNGEWEGELHQKAKDGQLLITYSRWTMVRDKQGKPSARLIITRNITEQRALESKILRTQRLENLGSLAGGIAHDLNNVLAPVLMATQVLEKHSADPHIKEISEAMEKNILRGRDIIKQVLLFARGGEEGFAPRQLRYIIDDMKAIMRETFPRNIVIRVRAADDLKTIMGDSTQLHQVLMNLCVNARDAMPGGGQLRITASNITVDEKNIHDYDGITKGNYVFLTVSDTGTGIPKEIQEKVFEPYFTTKDEGKGTGLGLSTIDTIVKSHKGSIKLQSEIGKGTEFRIYLPTVPEDEEVPLLNEEKVILPSHGETILLVDDEMTILHISKEVLESFGYHVIAKKDGADAITTFTKAAKGSIQLAIIDSVLPAMDGKSIIAALRQLDPNIKIILSTGTISEITSQKMIELNIQASLAKPYTARHMLETVSSVLHT